MKTIFMEYLSNELYNFNLFIYLLRQKHKIHDSVLSLYYCLKYVFIKITITVTKLRRRYKLTYR